MDTDRSLQSVCTDEYKLAMRIYNMREICFSQITNILLCIARLLELC